MKFLKSVSRLLTIPVLGKERRKRARLEVEEALNALFRTEKYIYTRRFEQAAALNLSLPRQNFHVISLGTNCFPRMTLNLWGLKPRKAEGEPSMPFDLSVHPLPVVVKYLKNQKDILMRLNLMRKTVIGLIRPTVLSSFMTNRMTGIFLWIATGNGLPTFGRLWTMTSPVCWYAMTWAALTRQKLMNCMILFKPAAAVKSLNSFWRFLTELSENAKKI